jgi:hypothetical protein
MIFDEVVGVAVAEGEDLKAAAGEATSDTDGEASFVDVSPGKGVGESAATVTGAADVVVGCSGLANVRPPACATTPIAATAIRPARRRRRTGLLSVQRIERALDLGVVAGGGFTRSGQG